MPLIDEEGNLFGVLNVIDALVVLVLVAVVVAGVAVVGGLGGGNGEADDSTSEPEAQTQYATVELGTQPGHVVSEISEGDVAEDHTLTITDRYVLRDDPATYDSDPVVYLRVALEGERTGEDFEFDGEAVETGSELSIATDAYDVTGEVTHLADDGERLSDDESWFGSEETTTIEVSLTNVDQSVTAGLTAGQSDRFYGQTDATIESIDRQPADVVTESADGDLQLREHPRNEDVTLEVELRTHETEPHLRFRGESLRHGESVVLHFETRTIDGEVTEIQ